jgi:hypothetical protein
MAPSAANSLIEGSRILFADCGTGPSNVKANVFPFWLGPAIPIQRARELSIADDKLHLGHARMFRASEEVYYFWVMLSCTDVPIKRLHRLALERAS